MKLNEIKQQSKHSNIEDWLKDKEIEEYTIRDNGIVDVATSVNLPKNTTLTKLPVKFGIVKGDFRIAEHKNLQTLEGCPDEVTGDFDCSFCFSLTSYNGAPKIVKGMFSAGNNENVTEFGQQLPKQVKALYLTWNSNLTSLKGSPIHITEYVNLIGCYRLKSFKSDMKYVGEDFLAWNCDSVTTLSGLPDEIHGRLEISELLKVKNYLSLFNVDGLKEIITPDINLSKILNKHYHDDKNVAACQEELIEAGLEEYAEF